MVGRGRISVAGAVDLANCMVDDGMVQGAVQSFASLGCQNPYPANTERDLYRAIKGLFGLQLEPYTIWMNLQVTCQGFQILEFENITVPILKCVI